MTVANLISTGAQELQFRFVIEGCPDQWVSHRSLAGSAGDGRTRRYGLSVNQPIEFEEKAILQEAELELSGMSLTIEERDDQAATYAFARKPKVLTYIAADVSTNDPQTVTVDDTTAISTNQYVHIGTETWKVNSKTSTTLTVARAQWQSKVQKHFIEVGADARSSPITDAPGAFRNRRAFVYAHGPTELSPTAAGTLWWRGVVARPPRLVDAVRWVVDCDPITSLLEQEVAGDTDRPIQISGAYYPWSMPLRYQVVELGTDSAIGFGSGGISNSTEEFYTIGYFAEDADLVADLNGQTDVALAGWNNRYHWVPDAQGHPVLVVTTHATTPKYVQVYGGSRIDGVFSGMMVDVQGTQVFQVQPNATYYVRTVNYESYVRQGWPRSWIAATISLADKPVTTGTARTDAPKTRIHLNAPLSLVVGDSIGIKLYRSNDTPAEYLVPIVAVNGSGDPNRNDVDLDEPSIAGAAEGLNAETTIRIGRNYGERIDVRTFRDAIVAKSVEKNRGTTPWLTDDDLASFAEAEDAAEELGQPAMVRNYAFAKPRTVREVLKEELKLIGCYLTIDLLYEIQAKRLRVSTQTEAATFAFNDTNIIAGRTGQWPSWESERGGIVNAVLLKQGYDPKEDKYLLEPIVTRNVKSISEHSATYTLEIAPFSQDRYAITEPKAAEIAATTLGFFRGDFHQVEIDVTWQAFNVRLGDTVSLTTRHLPDPATGTRGLSGAIATVIGRRWTYPGIGRITLLVHTKRVAGYAPNANVVTDTHEGSNVHLLTVTQNFYAPTGVNDLSYFAQGDEVEVYQFDNAGTATRTATVLAIPSATTIRVQASSSSFAGSGWVLALRDRADLYTPTANAGKYAWIANSNLLYNSEPAFEYAP